MNRLKGIFFLVLTTSFFFACTEQKTLEIYGPRHETADGDTLYHTIPPFAFINQEGEVFKSKQLKGKVYVADFFFTTCPTICPIMSTQMKRLQDKTSGYENFEIISFSVNPEHDTPEILKAYGEDLEADFSNWNFLTGDQESIHDIGYGGFFVNAMEDEVAPGGFLHSEFFILVDKDGHIRGYYDGTSKEEVDQLAKDIKQLL